MECYSQYGLSQILAVDHSLDGPWTETTQLQDDDIYPEVLENEATGNNDSN